MKDSHDTLQSSFKTRLLAHFNQLVFFISGVFLLKQITACVLMNLIILNKRDNAYFTTKTFVP
jgi:hypothetical protein